MRTFTGYPGAVVFEVWQLVKVEGNPTWSLKMEFVDEGGATRFYQQSQARNNRVRLVKVTRDVVDESPETGAYVIPQLDKPSHGDSK